MIKNTDILSFQDYYVLEEGFREFITDKWNEVKFIYNKWTNLLKIIKTGNKKIIYQTADEFVNYIKQNLKLNKEIFLLVLDRILLKNKTYILHQMNPYLRVFVLVVMHILAGYGIYSAKQVNEQKYANLHAITQIVDSIKADEPPTPEVEQERQKETEKIVERIWGNFENRKDFIKMVKVFEAGDYEKPNIEPKPLPAYFDRTQTSIGFGTKAKSNEKVGTKISEIEAHNRLIEELTDIENAVKLMAEKKKWKLTNNQLNAFIDFAFNRGPNALQSIFEKSKSVKDTIPHIKKVVFARTTNKQKAKFNKSLEARRNWEAGLLK